MKEIKIYEIPNIDSIERIDDPYIGMIFYVSDIDTYYSVKTLKEINGINMKGSKVVEYVIDEYLDFGSGGGGGTGLTPTQLSNIAKIPAIQSTVDALPNNYASKNHNHSEYASSSHRHNASEIDNLPSGGGTGLTTEQAQQLQTAYTHSQSKHVTMDEVNNAIANAQLGGSGGNVDLSSYATITQLNKLANIVEENHDFSNETISIGGKTVQFKTDYEGNPINCHGMGIMYYNGVYYAYGESKTGETRMGSTGYEFIETTGINCYSSTDLINWRFENKVIKPDEINTDSIIHTSKVMERPKCVYNKKTNKFVLFWHADNEAYSFSQIGIATCDSPTGDFTVLGSSRPTTNATTCRDFTIFVDDDDKAYAFISQDGNSNMYAHLLDDNYTSFTTTYAQVIGNNALREAPAVFKYNNEYYILSSGCTGWNPNPSKIHKSSTILGTYVEQNNPCKNDTNDNSYGSQSTYVIQVDPNKFNCNYIACFDQWNKTDLEKSTYLWLPLFIDESDGLFYVDNQNNNKINHKENVKNRQYLISDPSNYFFNKTIEKALQELYEMLLSAPPSNPDQPVEATAIKITPSTATISTGKTKTFTCTVTPTTATSSTAVEWSIDNSNATIVASGKTCTVTGVTAGSSVLTATAGSLTSTATITIEQSSTPVNRVFAINSESYASESNTLTDLDNGLVATLVGTPTVSNNMINFTTSDTFSFDIYSLSLTDFTLRFIYQYTTNLNANIMTIGQGTWANSFTFYQRNNTIIFNGDSASISGNTVGGTNLSSSNNRVGDYVDVGSDIEIVLSYNSSTRAINIWVNGILAQDGTVSKDIYTSLTKLCNTEGNARFAGGYKLIEIYNVYHSTYPTF